MSPDVAELAVAGLRQPALLRVAAWCERCVESSRLVAVHGEGATARAARACQFPTTLNASTPSASLSISDSERRTGAEVVAIQSGRTDETRIAERDAAPRARCAARYGIAGGRGAVRRVRRADAGEAAAADSRRRSARCFRTRPAARLLLARRARGARDIAADVARRRLADRVIVTGYLDDDEDLTDHHRRVRRDAQPALAHRARDVGSVAPRARGRAGRRSITDLVHLSGRALRWIRGRGQRVDIGCRASGIRDRKGREASGICAVSRSSSPRPEPTICVAIEHPRRGPLAAPRDAAAGGGRGAARAAQRRARVTGGREHPIEAMADDYERVMRGARQRCRGAHGRMRDAASALQHAGIDASRDEQLAIGPRVTAAGDAARARCSKP